MANVKDRIADMASTQRAAAQILKDEGLKGDERSTRIMGEIIAEKELNFTQYLKRGLGKFMADKGIEQPRGNWALKETDYSTSAQTVSIHLAQPEAPTEKLIYVVPERYFNDA